MITPLEFGRVERIRTQAVRLWVRGDALPHAGELSQVERSALIPVHLQRGDERFLRNVDLAE
jgi:hypothetical protein